MKNVFLAPQTHRKVVRKKVFLVSDKKGVAKEGDQVLI